jgi:hypothetical protein
MEEVCEICGKADLRNNLIDPCACYKKFEEEGWVHSKCFELYLSTFEENVCPDKCRRCGRTYRFSLSRRVILDCAHLCNEQSLNHVFEMFAISVTLLSTLFAMSFINWKVVVLYRNIIFSQRSTGMHTLQEELTKEGGELIIVLAAIAVVMAGFTIRTLYFRWRRSSSEIFVSEV